jgi:hypothetical protein
MTSLEYSIYQGISEEPSGPIIEGNQTITDYIESKNKRIENKNIIKNKISKIESNPIYNIGYDKLDSNAKFDQMIQDSKSMLMQDKFLLGLGGLAIASLIVFGTQL